jgi:succinylglutamate desuccinylase
MLNVLEQLPAGLLEREAHELHQVLAGPTLVHLPGRRAEPLLVTVLLHGNESTGWLALRALLGRYRDRALPRSLSLLIGNVAAARHGLRRIEGQPDYNRIWSGDGMPEHAMARQVVEEMAARRVFASVDVHNNTGFNPHYACVNRLDHRFLHVATLFSRTVVYFIRPDTVQSMAMAELCPAVTLECGQPGQTHGTEHALEYLDACLHLAELPAHPVSEHDIDLFHTVAVVKVPEQTSFGFEPAASDIWFAPDLDHLNFRELPAGTVLGWVRDGGEGRLDVSDETGRPVCARYFTVRDGEIRTVTPVMPSMFTLDQRVIRQDCLGYLMERYSVPRAHREGRAEGAGPGTHQVPSTA